jgi:hypothetical protein
MPTISLRPTVQSCGWCYTPNKVEPGQKAYCWNCFHRVDVLRADCDCASCVEMQARTGITAAARMEAVRR